MIRSIGMIELISVAKGIEAADAMLKTAAVELLTAVSSCPGKYIVIVYGEVAAVKSAVEAGKEIAGQYLVDDLLIANVHPDIFPALTASRSVDTVKSIGVLESFSAAAMIEGADAALKSANLQGIELRVGNGLGGKSYFTMTGDVAAVEEGVQTGAYLLGKRGALVEKVIIPRPAEALMRVLL